MPLGTAASLALGTVASGVMGSRAAGKAAGATRDAANADIALRREIYEDTTGRFAPYYGGGTNAMEALLYEMGLGPRPTFGGDMPQIETFTETVGNAPGGGIVNAVRGGGQLMGDLGSSTRTGYRVGDQTFDTYDAAEAYARQNRTGGTPYEGYSMSPAARYRLEEGVDAIEGGAAARGGLFSGATLEALEGDRQRVVNSDMADYFQRLGSLAGMGSAAAGNMGAAGQNFAGGAGAAYQNMGQGAANAAMAQGQAWQTGINDLAGIYGYFNPMQAYSQNTLAQGQAPMTSMRPPMRP